MQILPGILLSLAVVLNAHPLASAQAQEAVPAPLLAIRRTPGALSEARFQVQLRNQTDHDLLLDVGTVTSRQAPVQIEFVLTDEDGRTHQIESLFGNTGIIAGRADPMILPLPSGATFSFPIDLKTFFDPAAHIWQLKLSPGKYRLKAEYAADPPQNFKCYGFPLWHGQVQSRTVAFTILPTRRRTDKEHQHP